jgi:hypothetical protein
MVRFVVSAFSKTESGENSEAKSVAEEKRSRRKWKGKDCADVAFPSARDKVVNPSRALTGLEHVRRVELITVALLLSCT